MKSVTQRLLEKIYYNSTNHCWEWTAKKNIEGYGLIKFEGKYKFAHRISYIQLVGQIPSGLEIDHLCRNRSCIKPSHLEAVSHLVNMQRGKPGKKASKLTATQVKQIKSLKGKFSERELGRKYKVSNVHIHYILSGQRWQSI